MNEKKRPTVLGADMVETMSALVLESSPEDLVEALGQKQFDSLAVGGRALAQRALSGAGFTKSRPETRPTGEVPRVFHQGLGAMLRLLKRRAGLTDQELGEQASVSEEEILRIELDPTYQPGPRTISRLESFFGLPRRSIAVLSGAVRIHEESQFTDELVRFAAKSASLGKLSREEKRLLGEFVKVLESYTDDA